MSPLGNLSPTHAFADDFLHMHVWIVSKSEDWYGVQRDWGGDCSQSPVSLHRPTISPCVGSDKPRMKALSVGPGQRYLAPPSRFPTLTIEAKDTCTVHGSVKKPRYACLCTRRAL